MKRGFFLILFSALLFFGCQNKQDSKSEDVSPKEGEIKITEGAVKEQKSVKTKASDNGQFYYSYNEEKQEYNEDETYTPVDAYRRIRSPYERVQISILISKLSKNFLIHCSACHDDYANGIIGPPLLDKDAKFIYNRLIDYKRGNKKNVLMKELVSKMEDKELESLAKEIAEFNKKVQKIKRDKR